MKILYYFPYDGSFMTEWQRVQIFNEMAHYGVEFEIFNPLKYSSYDEANEALIRKVNSDGTIDLFLNCASSEMLYPDTMKIISHNSVPKLLICFDNLHAPYMHKTIAPFFDLVWLTSWETESMFKKWGCNTIFCPYASNPFVFQNKYKENIKKVCFIGTPYGTRAKYFNELSEGGVMVDVYCKSNAPNSSVSNRSDFRIMKNFFSFASMLTYYSGRKMIQGKILSLINKVPDLVSSPNIEMFPKVSYDEMNGIYSNYALSLNIMALRNTAVLKHPIYKLHLRTFEIPMSYGLELTERNDEIESYFPNNEMLFYSTSEEMVSLAKYYTTSCKTSEILKIKENARRRAENEHCWKKRFEKVFADLGLKGFSFD